MGQILLEEGLAHDYSIEIISLQAYKYTKTGQCLSI